MKNHQNCSEADSFVYEPTNRQYSLKKIKSTVQAQQSFYSAIQLMEVQKNLHCWCHSNPYSGVLNVELSTGLVENELQAQVSYFSERTWAYFY